MAEETLEQRIQYISFLHKQNLNGRETEDELFEAGILAGIEETKEKMYSEEEVLQLLYKRDLYLLNRDETVELELPEEWFKQFKKK